MSTIFVKVAQIPGISKEVAINEGGTVRDAITAAELDTDMTGKTLQVNATTATLDQTVQNGDVVAIAKGAKGNA